VANAGTRDTRQGYWIDRVYLSTDPSLHFDNFMLAESTTASILRKGDSYTKTVNVTLPYGLEERDYYILVFTDSNIRGRIVQSTIERHDLDFEFGIDRIMARVPEFQDEGYNITSKLLHIVATPLPDLEATVNRIPEHATAGQYFDLTYTVKNN